MEEENDTILRWSAPAYVTCGRQQGMLLGTFILNFVLALDREEVTFPGFVDCIYLNAPQELLFTSGLGYVLSISNKK